MDTLDATLRFASLRRKIRNYRLAKNIYRFGVTISNDISVAGGWNPVGVKQQ